MGFAILAAAVEATEAQKVEAVMSIAYALLRRQAPSLTLETVRAEAPGEWMMQAYQEFKRQMFYLLPTYGKA